jgi:hypothetical protein
VYLKGLDLVVNINRLSGVWLALGCITGFLHASLTLNRLALAVAYADFFSLSVGVDSGNDRIALLISSNMFCQFFSVVLATPILVPNAYMARSITRIRWNTAAVDRPSAIQFPLSSISVMASRSLVSTSGPDACPTE